MAEPKASGRPLYSQRKTSYHVFTHKHYFNKCVRFTHKYRYSFFARFCFFMLRPISFWPHCIIDFQLTLKFLCPSFKKKIINFLIFKWWFRLRPSWLSQYCSLLKLVFLGEKLAGILQHFRGKGRAHTCTPSFTSIWTRPRQEVVTGFVSL